MTKVPARGLTQGLRPDPQPDRRDQRDLLRASNRPPVAVGARGPFPAARSIRRSQGSGGPLADMASL